MGEDPIDWRNQVVESYANEIMLNNGGIEVDDDGDIIITRISEELYENIVPWMTTKDWYFMNISYAERDIMSSYEYEMQIQRTLYSILRRYMTSEQQNLIYTDLPQYLRILQEIQDNTATVVNSIEATL